MYQCRFQNLYINRFLYYRTVLGQLPPRRIVPNPNSNPNPKPNPTLTGGQFSSGGIVRTPYKTYNISLIDNFDS